MDNSVEGYLAVVRIPGIKEEHKDFPAGRQTISAGGTGPDPGLQEALDWLQARARAHYLAKPHELPKEWLSIGDATATMPSGTADEPEAELRVRRGGDGRPEFEEM